jgi:hypothetical protein
MRRLQIMSLDRATLIDAIETGFAMLPEIDAIVSHLLTRPLVR